MWGMQLSPMEYAAEPPMGGAAEPLWGAAEPHGGVQLSPVGGAG